MEGTSLPNSNQGKQGWIRRHRKGKGKGKEIGYRRKERKERREGGELDMGGEKRKEGGRSFKKNKTNWFLFLYIKFFVCRFLKTMIASNQFPATIHPICVECVID